MANYNPQQFQLNQNHYPASNLYRYPNAPIRTLSTQHHHHHYVLLSIVIIAAILTTIVFMSYTNIWKIGTSQFNKGEEKPPSLPGEKAPGNTAVSFGNDAPPPLPEIS